MSNPVASSAGRADLHMHTRWSDGTYSVEELFAQVRAARLSAFALTDHDTVAGIDAIDGLAAEAGIECIPALELSTNYKGCDFHVLGYFVDRKNPELLATLETQRNERHRRAESIVARLRELGVPLSMDEVREAHGGRGSIGRPHIAMAMVKRGLVKDVDEAFQRWLRTGAPGYMEKYQFETLEGIALLRHAGGRPVLAHPGTSPKPALISELCQAGLDGIECAHPKHSESVEMKYRALAREHNLIETGGSDCHGEKTGDTPVGCRTVALTTVEALRRGRN